jgi:U3 small nucleolar RNA-associated protein 14
MSHLTIEEVAARRAELRHMRELMFRAEAKAKRVAKIKSKTYRKIHKKAREKNALTLDEIATLNPEAAAVERMKIEVARAKERATMRHKNTGKWAKQMMSRGQNLDVDQRRELNAQLERSEQLRRKIQGEDEDDDELSDSTTNPDEAVQDIADHAFDELRAVQAEGVPTPASGNKKTGLLDMKFMRDAANRDNREVDATVDDFQDDLVDLISDNKDVEIPQAPALSDSITVKGNEGRIMFKPRAEEVSLFRSCFALSFMLTMYDQTQPTLARKVVAQFSTESDTSSTTIKSSVEPTGDSSQLPPSPVEKLSAHPLTIEVDNPWLTIANANAKLSRKTNEALVSKGSAADVRSQAALKRQLARSEEALAHQAEDALVEIDLEDSLSFPTASVSSQTMNGKERKPGQNIAGSAVDSAFQDSDDDEDVNRGDNGEPSTKAFKQRDLVALAFAGDNVVEVGHRKMSFSRPTI